MITSAYDVFYTLLKQFQVNGCNALTFLLDLIVILSSRPTDAVFFLHNDYIHKKSDFGIGQMILIWNYIMGFVA